MKTLALAVLLGSGGSFAVSAAQDHTIATFSIVARDPASGELGVAVASRFFAVGAVVPFATANVGAVATQANANITFGPRALELLQRGATPEEIVRILVRDDPSAKQRQFGIVAADGSSATYTGEGANAWAGGRKGPNYAIQGNILAGEAVVTSMERAFLDTKGSLAQRMYAAMLAGENAGGDSRGKQSAAMLVVKERAGYNGGNDRAIDIRVDDHPEPFDELGRLLKYGEMNYAWNEGWTAFTEKRFAEALVAQERAVKLQPDLPELVYDLAVIRLAAGHRAEALEALERALKLNPKLKKQAAADSDLAALRDEAKFRALIAN
ncbi:MAG TPA: tetratricopeptide repeat protein [Thermoanaerobaculia bacterium]|nr:tetratricopeptide repeat protein [Thermoanaerobaculia bacterium]